MRIVIDARESGTTTGRYIDKLVENLHALKPQEELVVLTKSERVETLKHLAPDFEIVASDYKEFTFAEQRGFLRQLSGLKPDLVHFNAPQQPVRYGGRVVTTVHDLTTARFTNPAKNPLVFWFKQHVYIWVVKKVAAKSARILTPSLYVAEDVADYTRVTKDKIIVTHEAADIITDKAVPVPELRTTSYLLYVGRPLPHKNLDRLIEAFAELKKTYPELRLVLAGKKDVLFERYERAVKRQGIKDVIFTGFVTEGQLRWLYENTAAYVFPSLSEGFGLPGLEAMAHGAPVVSSNSTCLPEIYGNAAHYFDPVNVTQMVAKIAAVLDDPDLRQKLIQKGYAQARRYSWRDMAKKTLDVYREVLNSK